LDEDTRTDIGDHRPAFSLVCRGWRPYALALFAVLVSTSVPSLFPPDASRWALPLVNVVLFYPAFLGLVWSRQRRRALAVTFVWAGVSSLAVASAAFLHSHSFGPAVIKGISYKNEMFTWIVTGIGPESDPAQFLPQHALHLAVFAALSFLSFGFFGLVMGAILLNHMNFYYGALIAEAQNPWFAALLGWPVWAILRVAGYIFLGVGLADLGRTIVWGKSRPDWGSVAKLLIPGVVLVITDVLLKTALAPAWRIMLARAFGLSY